MKYFKVDKGLSNELPFRDFILAITKEVFEDASFTIIYPGVNESRFQFSGQSGVLEVVKNDNIIFTKEQFHNKIK